MTGATLVTVPSIIYGGLVVLGVVTGGSAGLPVGVALTPVQVSLYRAGHAHAGVLDRCDGSHHGPAESNSRILRASVDRTR
jgi:hypothetical protein